MYDVPQISDCGHVYGKGERRMFKNFGKVRQLCLKRQGSDKRQNLKTDA